MIKNAVIHQTGQLPLVADLKSLPEAGDVNLVCTNLHTVDGKRPTFIDDIHAWFLFPLVTIRFIEIPRASMAASSADDRMEEVEEEVVEEQPVVEEAATDPDPDLLARIRNV